MADHLFQCQSSCTYFPTHYTEPGKWCTFKPSTYYFKNIFVVSGMPFMKWYFKSVQSKPKSTLFQCNSSQCK